MDQDCVCLRGRAGRPHRLSMDIFVADSDVGSGDSGFILKRNKREAITIRAAKIYRHTIHSICLTAS